MSIEATEAAVPGLETVLIACAHGTNNVAGQQRINEVRANIAALCPGVKVLEAYVVPLLLTVGFHVQVDIAQAVESRRQTFAAAPLGPDPRLAKLLDERLGVLPDGWGVVLAAAGSSRPEAAEQIEVLAADLAVRRPERIIAAYGASARPSVPEAVEQLRAEGIERVAIASYLLAPGYFHDQLADAGADLVTEPLLPAELLAELALEHFDAAVRAASRDSR